MSTYNKDIIIIYYYYYSEEDFMSELNPKSCTIMSLNW